MKLHGVGILLARCAHSAWVRRIGILCLLVLGAGLPLARPEHFWLLLVALPVVCLSRPRVSRIAWGVAFGLCVLGALVRMFVGPGDIQVAANVFSPGNDHFRGVIPQPVLDAAIADYRARYGSYELEVPRPVARGFGQWRLPEGTTFRRRLLEIDSLMDWPLGAVNGANYNTYTFNHLERFEMDPVSKPISRPHMPYYVVVAFPDEHAGRQFCVRGNVFLRHDTGYERVSAGRQRECIMLPSASIVAAYQTGPHDELHLSLDATTSDVLSEIAYQALPWLLSTVAFLMLANLGSLTNRQRVIVALILVVSVVTIVNVRGEIARRDATPHQSKLSEILSLGAFVVHHEGWDGSIYAGFGRQIANAVLDGDYAEALRGGRSVYYYMPGARYAHALNLAFFGPNLAGLVLVVPLATVTLMRLSRRFLPNGQDRPFLLLWLLPILPVIDQMVVGYGLSTPIRTGATYATVFENGFYGLGEPVALLLLLGASVICLDLMQGRYRCIGTVFVAGFLIGLAVFIRPNWGPIACMVLGGVVLTSIRHSRWRQIVAVACSSSVVFVMLFHNWWFGGELVFTTMALELDAPWVIDMGLLRHAITLDMDAVASVRDHWGMLLTEGRLILIVASMVAVVLPLIPFWVRTFAGAALIGMIPFLFLSYESRYLIVSDLFAALVFWRLVFFEGRRSIEAAWARLRSHRPGLGRRVNA